MKLGPLEIGRHDPVATRLREELRSERWQSQLLEENLWVLEQQIVGDEEFRRLGMQTNMEFTRRGLDDLVNVSRVMYLSNPLLQRAINVTTYYTWAQGYEFHAEDDRIQQEVVEQQLQDEGNQLELYGHQAAILTDVDQQCDGNIFLALFTDSFGNVKVRTVPTDEIREIITNPLDRQDVWYYRRTWGQMEFDQVTGISTARTYEALYPDIRYNPSAQPASIGGVDVMWDAPIIHQKTGGFKRMQFGVPQTYAALDWARAYKKFLEDWHTIVASLARFAWQATSKKSKREKLKDRLGIGTPTGNELEEPETPVARRRPPVPGSVFAGGEDDKITAINKTGASPSAEDAKPSRMMVAAAMDLPDTILSGDPQQGALATAKTLDRPTELGFLSRQAMWASLHARIFRYTVDAKVRRGRLPGRVVRDGFGSYVEPRIDPSVEMQFPPVLEHDITETVNAIVAAATLEGKTDAGTIPRQETSQLLMNALGVDDVQDKLDELNDIQQAQVDAAVQALNSLAQGGDPNDPAAARSES